MAPRIRHIALAAALVAWIPAISCRSQPPASAIDPALAAAIPPGTTVLAGIDTARLRASELASKGGLDGLLHGLSLDQAHFALAAWTPNGFVVLSPRPAGSGTASDPLVTGSPDVVRAALDQHRTGRTGAPDLIERAAPLAGPGTTAAIWAVARGDATLPLTGNAANLNRVLHSSAYTTLALRLQNGFVLEATGQCTSPARAQDLENSLRGIVTLSATSLARNPTLAGIPQAIRVRRENATVTATLALDDAHATALIEALLQSR